MFMGNSHFDFRTQCVIMMQITRPRTPYYMRHFQIFDKIDSFLKNVSNVLGQKKVDYIFEESLHLYKIVWELIFSSIMDSTRK